MDVVDSPYIGWDPYEASVRRILPFSFVFGREAGPQPNIDVQGAERTKKLLEGSFVYDSAPQLI